MTVRIPYPTILNELSFVGVDTRAQFICLVKRMLGVQRAMQHYGYGCGFAYSRSVMLLTAFNGSAFSDWLSYADCRSSHERELIRLVSGMLDKGCVLEDIGIRTDDDIYFDRMRIYGGGTTSVPGFVASYIWQLPSIALCAGIFCGRSDFNLEREFLHVDGTIHKEPVCLKAFSDIEVVDQMRDELMSRLVDDIHNGSGLISAIREIMPYLSLSKGVADILPTISFKQFPIVREFLRLHEVFERCIAKRTSDFFGEYGSLKSIAMSESDSKMSEHPNCRDFRWEDGIVRKCEPHVKVGNGCRIHFLPAFSEEKLYIGYVGPHLDP